MAEVMKDSNTTWAGLIPDSWQSIIFSYAINNIRTGLNPRNNFELTSDDDYYYITIRNFRDGKVFLDEKCDRVNKRAFNLIQSRSKLKEGDILFASISDEANACLIEEKPKNWNINESVFSIDAKRNMFYPRYLYYLVINPAYYNDLRLDATGSTFHSIKQNKLYRSKLIMPSINEQRVIADFLDEKCAEIDKLSEDIQKQIEILNDYKQSTVTCAITRGIDIEVPMKKTSAEWLDTIPSDWEVGKMLYYLRQPICDGPHETPDYKEEGIPFISVDSLNETKDIDLHGVKKFISEKDYYLYMKKANIEKGDVLFTKAATIGKTAIVRDEKFMVWSPIAIIKAKQSVLDNVYLYYVLNCSNLIKSIELSGSYNTQANVGMREMERAVIPVPPLSMQKEIVSYLDNKCEQIDGSINEKLKQLSVISSYKKSIIYEYVTGKKRVKGAK